MSVDGFLSRHGFADASRVPLPADASFRRYERLVGGPRPALLMICPPGKEAIAPFVRVARHLLAAGLSAPEIIAEDDPAGLALVEDLGEHTFTRLLSAGEQDAVLYALAVDSLAVLHRRPAPPWAPAWDAAAMISAAKATFFDWWWPATFDAAAPRSLTAEFDQACTATLSPFADDPAVLTLRDFHVDNLLRVPGRDGVAACGLLDFQDAGAGHPAYDLVSLVEDARRNVPPPVRNAMIRRYCSEMGEADAARFRDALAAHAALRHLRVAALWTRLARRDGKRHYLAHAPRTWTLLGMALKQPACAPLSAWFDANVPPALRSAPEERAP